MAVVAVRGKSVGVDEVLASRRYFGTTETSTILDCPSHRGMSVSERDNAKHGMPVLLQLDFVAGCGVSVEQMLEEIKTKSRDMDGKPDFNSIISRDCPLCLEEGLRPDKPTRTARCFDVGSPRVFIATVGSNLNDSKSKPQSALAHVVDIYGSTYYLTGVVYCTGGGHHFEVQVFFGGCWRSYNDLRNSGELIHTHGFDPDWNRGAEYLFMYTRCDLVRHTPPPQASSGHEHDPFDDDMSASLPGGESRDCNGSSGQKLPTSGEAQVREGGQRESNPPPPQTSNGYKHDPFDDDDTPVSLPGGESRDCTGCLEQTLPTSGDSQIRGGEQRESMPPAPKTSSGYEHDPFDDHDLHALPPGVESRDCTGKSEVMTRTSGEPPVRGGSQRSSMPPTPQAELEYEYDPFDDDDMTASPPVGESGDCTGSSEPTRTSGEPHVRGRPQRSSMPPTVHTDSRYEHDPFDDDDTLASLRGRPIRYLTGSSGPALPTSGEPHVRGRAQPESMPPILQADLEYERDPFDDDDMPASPPGDESQDCTGSSEPTSPRSGDSQVRGGGQRESMPPTPHVGSGYEHDPFDDGDTLVSLPGRPIRYSTGNSRPTLPTSGEPQVRGGAQRESMAEPSGQCPPRMWTNEVEVKIPQGRTIFMKCLSPTNNKWLVDLNNTCVVFTATSC